MIVNIPTTLNTFSQPLDFTKLIDPVNDLERELLALPEFQRGYNWGKPRFGHPEGLVGLHVIEVLKNIDDLPFDNDFLEDLRLIAIAHDTFKYKEFELLKNGKPKIHHGLIARRFLEDYIFDEKLLDIIERHDEAFHIWRTHHVFNNPELAAKKLDALASDYTLHHDLYCNFFRVDTYTGDKLQAPFLWFQQEMEFRGIEF